MVFNNFWFTDHTDEYTVRQYYGLYNVYILCITGLQVVNFDVQFLCKIIG